MELFWVLRAAERTEDIIPTEQAVGDPDQNQQTFLPVGKLIWKAFR
jgi:hypothetical protein